MQSMYNLKHFIVIKILFKKLILVNILLMVRHLWYCQKITIIITTKSIAFGNET